MNKLILASGSPRRKELLEMAGFDFEVVKSGADETLPRGMRPADANQRTRTMRKVCLKCFREKLIRYIPE